MEASIKHHLTVGREHYVAGDYEQAEPHLEKVLESYDGFADVHNMLGVIYYDTGRVNEAKAAFERAVSLNPHYTEAALNLAVVYNELGRYEDAKAVYDRATSTAEGESGAIERLDAYARGKIANLHFDLGAAYEAVGLARHAVAEYRKALDLCPTFVDIRTKLATTLRDLGRIDEALDELLGIRESTPEYLPARIQLGVTLWRAGRVEDARAEWRFVAARDPSNKSCHVYLKMTEDGGGAPSDG